MTTPLHFLKKSDNTVLNHRQFLEWVKSEHGKSLPADINSQMTQAWVDENPDLVSRFYETPCPAVKLIEVAERLPASGLEREWNVRARTADEMKLAYGNVAGDLGVQRNSVLLTTKVYTNGDGTEFQYDSSPLTHAALARLQAHLISSGRDSVSWRNDVGFVSATLVDLAAMADLSADREQEVYDAERTVYEAFLSNPKDHISEVHAEFFNLTDKG